MVLHYDLCIVTDATASMEYFHQGIKASLPQLLQLSKMTGLFEQVAVLAYRDYCDPKIIEWSGWKQDAGPLTAFVSQLDADGGGDRPEAVKTAFDFLLQKVVRPTVVILYTDAPPHSPYVGSSYLWKEIQALGAKDADWVTICGKASQKGLVVHAILSVQIPTTASWYALMACRTGGSCSFLSERNQELIGKHTVGLLLSLMGQEYDFGQDGQRASSLSMDAFEASKITNELNANGLLPPLTRPLQMSPMSSVDVQCLQNKTDDLLVLFERDSAYKEKIYEVFDAILTPDNAIALTYNTLFGKFWRAICRSRDDPRRDGMAAKLGVAMANMSSSQKDSLKKFIEMSYDQSEEIKTRIDEASSASKGDARLVLETSEVLSRPELLEISRSCAPAVIARVGKILCGLRIVTDSKGSAGLPLDMDSYSLFKVLPHLMCPGTMFSLRPAALLAILAVISSSILKEKALQFLVSIRGKWIDQALPENISIDLVRLLLRLPEVLTPEELDQYTTAYRIGGLRINGLTTLDVVTGYASNKTTRPDDKEACMICGTRRSPTMLNESGMCAMCVIGKTQEEPVSDDKSVWCECTHCKVHYVVIRPELLKVKPKCHFCREGEPAPKVQCSTCLNFFLDQRNKYHGGSYVCPPCKQHGEALVSHTEVTVRDYAKGNGLEFVGLSVSDLNTLWSGRSLYHVKDVCTKTPCVLGIHKVNKKAVHNVKELQDVLTGWMDRGEAELGTCCLCFEDLPKHQLVRFCGRKKCEAMSCTGCAARWYSATQPGKIVYPPHLCCAFCKKPPAPQLLNKYNRQMQELRRVDISTLDPLYYHAWCMTCKRVQPAVNKDCAADAVPEINGFVCDTCKEQIVDGPDILTKDCPGCGVTTEKSSGCNHIECAMCHTHWCYVCTNSFNNSGAVYKHMTDEHGGIGLDYDFDDDGEEDEYW